MDVLSVLEAARAPLSLEEIREYSGAMYSDERLESLVRSGDVKEISEIPGVYWVLPLELRKQRAVRKQPLQMNGQERQKCVDAIVTLREKLNSTIQELEALELQKDAMPTDEQLKEHRERLHRYNMNKDIGQELIGRLADIEHIKVKDVYEKYGIDQTE